MIKVGIIFNPSDKWWGGVSYFKNLFYAVSVLKNKKIQIVLFTGKRVNDELIHEYDSSVEIIKSVYFDNPGGYIGNLWNLWFFILQKIQRKHYLSYLLDKNGISVISHSNIYKKSIKYKIINWIADFQHIKLPRMFNEIEIQDRDRRFYKLIKSADVMLLNSKSTFNDFSKFAPEYVSKARILPFVSAIGLKNLGNQKIFDILKRYNIGRKYFYLPNQFWKHKNHKVVFDAVKKLKDRKKEVLVVCSGFNQDNRDLRFFKEISEYIKHLDIENNIKILGFINSEEVLYLIRYSISVINPSLFEGWSTTVEEAKSIGKNIILSDIPVHREQNPPGAIYFDPYDSSRLAKILLEKWNGGKCRPDFHLEKKAKKEIAKRIKNFGEGYQKIVLKLTN